MAHCLQVTLLLLVLTGPVWCGSKDTLPKFPNKSGTNTNKQEKVNPPKEKTGEQGQAGGVTTPSSQQELFRLSDDGWSACERRTATSCGSSLQNITCIYTADDTQVPMRFCNTLETFLEPTFRQCGSCPEDCAMTVWSAWSQCSSTCSPATRFRTRRVLTTARHGGGGCGDLSESEPCKGLDGCEFEVDLPVYTWKIGEWSSCRQVSQQAKGSIGCGIGRRLRSVSCVGGHGEKVNNDQCLVDQDPRKKESQPPAVAACSLQCDCRTSSWSPWGACSHTCQSRPATAVDTEALQTRTREILTLPENGGLPCPSLTEQRECEGETLPECPRFEWVAEEWQLCRLSRDNEGTCGAGRQKRQVYCIQEADVDRIPVNEDACINSPVNSSTHQPPMKRACWLDCPVDCQLGQWLNWSPCSQSCEEGIQIRQREVLVTPAFGGDECGPLAEAKECEFVDCSWWHTSRWTSCKLNHGLTDCGPGVHARVQYCMSARDELLDDEDCPGPEPDWQEACKIPCPTDCVISEWSDWGSCSKTCGKKGGMQMRSRQILAFSDLEEDSCLPESELNQYKPCNLHVSCQTYTWQVGAWGECFVNGTATGGDCTQMDGVQQRDISCEKESGVAPDESFCDPSSKPAGLRTCDIPCPVDCHLSYWSALSDCSQTCGVDGHRVRSQRVVQLSSNGGAPCPSEANEDGVIIKVEMCDNLPPCYSYQWNAGNWSECEVLGIDCGKGLQTRAVHCGRSDGTTVEPGVCLREFLSIPPPSHQQCIVPCAGDCLLSEWTDFGPCVHSCGDTGHGGYCRMRSRAIISIDPATDNAEELCPHITISDLRSYVPCDDTDFTYGWKDGAWQSCLLDEGEECGQGTLDRNVLCQRSDATLVPDHFCEVSTVKPSSQAPCDVPCVVGCVVSEWMAWSPCTQACGQGLKTRMRDIQRQSANGGRDCPPLIDSMICIEMLCDQLEWEVSQWGSCEAIDPRSNCGLGTQVRTVSCKAGESVEAECAKRFPLHDNSRGCVLPCPGDCVMSNWQNSAPCPNPCQRNSTKSQMRSVIRHPTDTGEQCGDLTQTTACTDGDCVGYRYRLVTGEWSRCKAISGECGSGVRQRTVNCINDDGFPVATHHCPAQNITTTDACDIPCPSSCDPKRYSDWSACNASCGLTGVIERSRVTEGRCSEKWTLKQTMPCNGIPCHIYTWRRSLWSECRFETERGCGSGERTRLVECERDDGLTVDYEYCIMQDNPDVRRQGVLNQILSNVNETELDIETSQHCDKPCPGDCLMSSWSPETSCFTSCYSPRAPAFITSSRSVTSPAMPGGAPCPENLIQERSCLSKQALCPNYTWRTGSINADTRTRDVWCQIEDKGTILNVTRGCVKALRPASSLKCDPLCTALGTTCDQGKCRCQEGFEGDGRQCFPVSGCVTDDHCPLPNTFCDPHGQCSCRSGFMLDKTTDLCAESNVIPDGNRQAGTSPASLSPDEGNNVEQFQDKSDIWKWVVVASVVAVTLLVVIIGVFFIRRRRAAEVGFNPIPTSLSDSDFPLSKMVKDVVTKC